MESSVIDGGMALAAGDFSLWSLFQRADMVVKAVMIGLLVASIWSWAIIIDKWMKVGSLSRKADKLEDVFWSGKSLEDLYQNLGHKPAHPMAVVFVSAMRELKRSMEKKESSSCPFLKEILIA